MRNASRLKKELVRVRIPRKGGKAPPSRDEVTHKRLKASEEKAECRAEKEE